MGLEEMLSAIKTNTSAQRDKIIADARSEAERIEAEANAKSETLISQSRSQSEKEVIEGRIRSIASFKLEAKRKMLEAKDEIMRAYEEQAASFLNDFTKSPEYKDFLLKVTKDGISQIGSDAIVQINVRDRNILNGSGFQISSDPISSIGGAIITSADEKRRVDNTVESIFDDRKQELRLELMKQVFGDQK
jgi:V/A-type H+/Na+-transporting ATPase subunit E